MAPAGSSKPSAGKSASVGDRAMVHVALIMDGNGRWARARGLPRTLGHKAGVEALKRTVRGAPDAGVDRLTVFGFSTENWRRPGSEVSELMRLLKSYVESDLERLVREGVRVKIIGRRENLAADILAVIDHAESMTVHNSKFLLQVAFNYGGQADIADAARKIALEVKAGRLDPSTIDETVFAARLSSEGLAPDLIVRTSGEQRISNFLLWEAAYAELVFQDVLWPDYGPEHLRAAVDEFFTRERRYGGADVDVLATG
ncbi:polyprenyl diphosphate synthase [soil metagenome]